MLKADLREAVESIISLISLNIKFIEVYVLDIDPRGYIKHIKRRQITLICILLYMLEADPKKAVKSIYKPRN